MKIKMVKVIVAALLVGMGSIVAADECVDRTGHALAELQQAIPGMNESQITDAKRILDEICGAPVAAATSAEAAMTQAEPDTPTVLGIDFNKAEPDSKGHSRLKKTH